MSEFSTGHLYECGCLYCRESITLGTIPDGRRVVTIEEYGSFRRVTVPIKAKKRSRWLEAEN